MKITFKYIGCGLAEICLLLVLSCQKDESFYNTEAKPPQQLSLITQGDHFAGVVTFNFNTGLPSTEVSYVILLVDSAVVSESYNSPYILTVDTKQWPEGEHVISIAVVKVKSPEIGMLSLIGAPSVIYSAAVVFDQTPPTAVVLESVTWDDAAKSPLLSWSKNTDLNFYGYIISRYQFGAPSAIDTVFDQNTTSVHATDNYGAMGISYTYSVDVTNRNESVPSNQATLTYPETLPVTVGPPYRYVRPILSSQRDEMYVIDYLNGASLKAISTLTNTVIRSYDIVSQNLALSKDDSKLYLLSNGSLVVLNAANFDLLLTVYLNFNGGSVVCGRSDRLYVVTSWPENGVVKILDANSGNEIGEIGIEAPDGLLSISSDNNTLYVADASNDVISKGKIYKVDISTDVTQVIKQQEASDYIRTIQLSANDQILYVAHDFDYPTPTNNFVDAWSTSTLQSVTKYKTPYQVFDFNLTSTSIFVSIGDLFNNTYYGVKQFDLSVNTVLNSWKFLYPGARVTQVSKDNKFLYVFQDKSWIVPLSP